MHDVFFSGGDWSLEELYTSIEKYGFGGKIQSERPHALSDCEMKHSATQEKRSDEFGLRSSVVHKSVQQKNKMMLALS